MASYEYANARIRSLRTRLFSRHELSRFAESETIEDLIGELGQTDYAAEIDEVLTRRQKAEVVFEACRRHLERRLKVVRSFFGEDGKKSLFLLASIHDRDNIMAIVRGLAARVLPSDIHEALEASGNLELEKFRMIAQAGLVREALIQAQWLAPEYGPWLRAGKEALIDDDDPQFLQDVLNESYGRWLNNQIAELKEGEQSLTREWLAIQADFENVVLALRWRRQGALKEEGHRKAQYAAGGSISADSLGTIVQAPTDSEALSALRGSSRGSVFSSEETYDIEALHRLAYLRRLGLGLAYFQRDPISIAPGIAYFEAKRAEVRLLRYTAGVIASGAGRSSLRQRIMEEALWES